MTPQSAIAFAAWLQVQHPKVFASLVKTAKSSPKKLGDLDWDDFAAADDFDSAPSTSETEFSIADSVSAETAFADSPISVDSNFTPGGVDAFAPSTGNVPTIAPATGGVGAAVAAVGNFLASNPKVITTALGAAASIINTNAQAQAIAAQAARAAAGQAPANITYNSAGQPVLNTSSGQVPLNSSQISALTPSNILQSSMVWIILGAAALLYLTSEE